MDIESAKGKVAKLLALSKSSNAHEAEQALAKAEALMAELGFTVEEISPVNSFEVISSSVANTTYMYWLARTLCLKFGAKAYIKGNNRGISLIGRQSEVATIKEMLQYLLQVMHRSTESAVIIAKANGTYDGKFRAAFRKAFCMRLYSIAKEKSDAEVPVANALVHVPGLSQEVEDYIAKNIIAKTVVRSSGNSYAASLGRDAAGKVSLNAQLN
jgi:hypothetical protein